MKNTNPRSEDVAESCVPSETTVLLSIVPLTVS